MRIHRGPWVPALPAIADPISCGWRVASGPKGVVVQSVDRYLKRARNLVALISHPRTGEHEALNAFRALGRVANANGVGLDTLRFAPASVPCPYARERIEELEQARVLADEKMQLQARLIAGLQARVDAQDAELAALRAGEYAAHAEPDPSPHARPREQSDYDDPAVDDGLVQLGPIVEQIVEKTGRKHWTTAAAHALALPVVEMRAWTVLKTMPATMAHKLASLSAEDLMPASRKPWSDAEVGALRLMVRQGMDNLAIALALTAQFGRRIFETGVARKRSKLVMAEWGQRRGAGSASYAGAHAC